jgi:hypothetical protein
MSSDQEQNEQRKKPTPKSKIKTRGQIEQESGAAPVRRPTPSSILVYIGIVIFIFFYGFLVPGEPTIDFGERLAVTVFLRIMIIFLLINRSTIGWVLAILFEVSQIILFPLSFDVPNEPKTWGMIFLHTAAMALLLTSATRQHIWAPDPEIIKQSTGVPDADEVEQHQADASSSSSSRSSSSP